MENDEILQRLITEMPITLYKFKTANQRSNHRP